MQIPDPAKILAKEEVLVRHVKPRGTDTTTERVLCGKALNLSVVTYYHVTPKLASGRGLAFSQAALGRAVHSLLERADRKSSGLAHDR